MSEEPTDRLSLGRLVGRLRWRQVMYTLDLPLIKRAVSVVFERPRGLVNSEARYYRGRAVATTGRFAVSDFGSLTLGGYLRISL